MQLYRPVLFKAQACFIVAGARWTRYGYADNFYVNLCVRFVNAKIIRKMYKRIRVRRLQTKIYKNCEFVNKL